MSSRANRPTNEVIDLLCGATLETKCSPCTKQARRLRQVQIREGWHRTTEPVQPKSSTAEHKALITYRAHLEFARAEAMRAGEWEQLADIGWYAGRVRPGRVRVKCINAARVARSILGRVNHVARVSAEELVAYAREAFGWGEDVVVSAGPRGALGQVWRVDVGPARYALKESFVEPPSEAVIEAESAFTRRAAEEGVRLPASHPDRHGRHLVPAPGGTSMRLYDWIDLRPVELTAYATPGEIGALLARLHRCAPAAAVEPDGVPPDPWYDHVPAAHEWADVSASGAAWAPRLADRLSTLPELCAAVAPADPAGLVVCHRDLHPENVLNDPDGALVVVDWDNLGPAAPGRELARALFDWFYEDSTADLDAMRRMYQAYLREGGPGRVTEPADFTMLIASRLNFLLRQTRVAIDPRAESRHREWAEHEIDETLRILPTPRQLAQVLELTAPEGGAWPA